MIYLEPREIKTLNLAIVQQYGEDHILTKPNELEAAVYRHKQYERLYDATAALMHSLIMDHCFFQGNKRTAIVAGMKILRSEKKTIALSDVMIADRVNKMVVEHWPREKISAWLKRNCEK